MKLTDISILLEHAQLPETSDAIADPTAFTDDWIDPEIVGRDDFLSRITKYVALHKSGTSSHIIIGGQKGFGKSFLLKSVFYTLKSVHPEDFPTVVYVDCQYRSNNILRDICVEFCIDSWEAVIQQARSAIIVFDHIDRVERLDRFIQTVIKTVISAKFSTVYLTQDPVHLIARLAKIPSHIFEIINLHPYTEETIVTILQHRAESGFQKIYHPLLKNILYRTIARKTIECAGGNCRFAISVMYRVVLDSLRDKTEITIPYIERYFTTTDDEKTEDLVNLLHLSDVHTRVVIKLLSATSDKLPQADVYVDYCKFMQKRGILPHSYVWFNSKMHFLVAMGYVQIVKIGGRGNIKNLVQYTADSLIVQKAIRKAEEKIYGT